jgi:hypothetical protein
MGRDAGAGRAVIKSSRAKLLLCLAARQRRPVLMKEFQFSPEIIIARRRDSVKLLTNLTKEKL